MLRFTDDTFDEHLQSTIGVDFKVHEECVTTAGNDLVTSRYILLQNGVECFTPYPSLSIRPRFLPCPRFRPPFLKDEVTNTRS